LSLSQQFLLASFVILFANMLGIGWWVGQQIELGVLHRTAAATALYVDSFIQPLLQPLAQAETLTPAQMDAFDRLLNETPLGQEVVSFKVWGPGGRVLYATDPAAIGQVFPPSPGLVGSWQGAVTSDISDLEADENVSERAQFSRLMEIYSPVRQSGTNRIIAVAEFYHPLDALEDEITEARLQSWLVVGLGTLLMYLLLAGLVQRGSNTIRRQQAALEMHVAQLTDLLAQNAELHQRVQRAARRTAELNERFLRRISAELHDGPAQDLALALLQLDSLHPPPNTSSPTPPHVPDSGDDLERIESSINHALQELRAIAAGLRLPELEHLSLAEAVNRAVRSHERHTLTEVKLAF
jgi:signal transduction histidine kinase